MFPPLDNPGYDDNSGLPRVRLHDDGGVKAVVSGCSEPGPTVTVTNDTGLLAMASAVIVAIDSQLSTTSFSRLLVINPHCL